MAPGFQEEDQSSLKTVLNAGESGKIKSLGVSLIEGLIVIALAGFLLLVFVPAIARTFRAYDVTTSASQISLDVRFVRNTCIRNKYPFRITFNDENASPNPNTYLIQSDTDSNGSFETSVFKKLNSAILIDNANTNVDEIEFGTRGTVADTAVSPVSAPYTVQIEHKTNTEMKLRISITTIGGVSSQKIGSW